MVTINARLAYGVFTTALCNPTRRPIVTRQEGGLLRTPYDRLAIRKIRTEVPCERLRYLRLLVILFTTQY